MSLSSFRSPKSKSDVLRYIRCSSSSCSIFQNHLYFFAHVFHLFYHFPLRFRTRRLGPFSMESLSREGSEASDADAEGGPEGTIDLQVVTRWFISSPMPPGYLDHPFCLQNESELIYFSFLYMPFVLLKNFLLLFRNVFYDSVFGAPTSPNKHPPPLLPSALTPVAPHRNPLWRDPPLRAVFWPAVHSWDHCLPPQFLVGFYFSIQMQYTHLHSFLIQLVMNWDAILWVGSIFSLQFICKLRYLGLVENLSIGRSFFLAKVPPTIKKKAPMNLKNWQSFPPSTSDSSTKMDISRYKVSHFPPRSPHPITKL